MKTNRSISYLFLGMVILGLAGAIFTAPVAAQGQLCPDPQNPGNIPCPPQQPGQCYDAQGAIIACPQPPENTPVNTPYRVPTKVNTRTPTPTETATPTVTFTTTSLPCLQGGSGLSAQAQCTPTPTPCLQGGSGLSAQAQCTPTPPPCLQGGSGLSARPGCTQTPTPNPNALLITGGGPGPNNPNSVLPAIQDLGPLGMIIAALIIITGILASFFIAARRRKIGSTGGSDLLPAIQMGGNENLTATTPDFGGGMESATLTVHDVGDISPDGALNAREAASDPGGVHQPPGSPTKPPNPNIGDKSGGGTL